MSEDTNGNESEDWISMENPAKNKSDTDSDSRDVKDVSKHVTKCAFCDAPLTGSSVALNVMLINSSETERENWYCNVECSSRHCIQEYNDMKIKLESLQQSYTKLEQRDCARAKSQVRLRYVIGFLVMLLGVMLAVFQIYEEREEEIISLQNNDAVVEPSKSNVDIGFLLQILKTTLPSEVKVEDMDPKLAYDCYLEGLSSGINSHGDAVLELNSNKAVFSFGMSTNRITIRCRWKKKVTFVKMKGKVTARTDRVSIRARLSLELGIGGRPILEEFKVTEIHKIKTDVSGAGPLNWIGEKILNKKINGARDTITRELEQNVYAKFQSKLDDFKLQSFA